MAMPMGSIITEVAVLEIHMDKKAVATIKPKIIFLILVPIKLIIFNAILLCKFQRSMAMAKINPPIYRKTYLWPYEAVVSVNFNPPVKGNRIIGNKEVTAIGIASVIHQTVINTAIPAVNHAVLFNPTGGSVKIKPNSIKKPVMIPYKDILFFVNN